MMKRKVWEKVKWDSSGIYNMSSLEEYKEGKHNEDTHFSLRCRENKFLLIHNHDSISFHDDDSYTNVGRICNRRRDDRSYSWVLDLSLSFSPSVLCDFAVSLFSNGFLPESADILRYGLINFPSNYDLQKTFEATIVKHSGVLEDSRYSPNGDPLYLEFKSFYDDGSDSDSEPEGLTQEQMNIL